MEKKYVGLDALLQQDQQAKQFYSGLPGYLKALMTRRKDEIHSAKQLQEYAGRILDSLHR